MAWTCNTGSDKFLFLFIFLKAPKLFSQLFFFSSLINSAFFMHFSKLFFLNHKNFLIKSFSSKIIFFYVPLSSMFNRQCRRWAEKWLRLKQIFFLMLCLSLSLSLSFLSLFLSHSLRMIAEQPDKCVPRYLLNVFFSLIFRIFFFFSRTLPFF